MGDMSKEVANTIGSPQKIYSSFNGYSASKKKTEIFKIGKEEMLEFYF
jgi:hypothetical protein